MTSAQNTLLNIIANALFDCPAGQWTKLSAEESAQVLQEAKSQAVVLLAYDALRRSASDVPALQAWSATAMSVVSNNARVVRNHELLQKWMTEAGVPYVVLKGCASAAYYPRPSLRAMGDVDFLVAAQDLDRAGAALVAQGLEPWDEEHISHIVYRKSGMHLEMHFNVAGIPDGRPGELVRGYLSDVFEHPVIKPIGNSEAAMPSDLHHGLIILLHTCHHLTGEGVGLRHLCDWAVFENSFSDAEFRAMFEDKLRAIGLWRFAQVLTAIAVKYLGAQPREWAEGCDEQLVDALMEDILAGGNFGNKDSQRVNQAYLISNRGKNGVGHTGMLRQFFASMNNVVYVKWPVSKRLKVLLPLGWVFFGTRHAVRVALGKRSKVNVSRMISGAGERRELYARLGLYEDGDE